MFNLCFELHNHPLCRMPPPPKTTLYFSLCPKLTRFPQARSTDVVLSSLCPPGRWSGAGVGIKMLRGIPLLENKKGFLVLVYWFQKGFMFSEDVWYILPNFQFMSF